MNVGYYPIRKNEIMQVIKMVNYYNRKELSAVNEILENYNVNEKKKEDIYKSLEECITNKKNSNFNTSYGLCIAKVQKIFRGNFIFHNKSLTELLQKYPMLTKYRTNIAEFIKSKNNKYEIFNELKDLNSSGVYMSSENIEDLYADYNSNADVKRIIDDYYGDKNNKFIEVLDYCLDNKCGLLEADFLINSNNISRIVQETKIENNTNSNTQYTSSNKNNKKITSVTAKTWTIIGFRFLFELLALIIIGFINLGITKINSIPLKLIVSVTVSIIAILLIWLVVIKVSFLETTIERAQVPKLMKNLTIFVVILLVLNVFMDYESYIKSINTEINYEISTDKDIALEEIKVSIYGTKKDQQKFKKDIENLKEDIKKEVRKKTLPYYIGTCISKIILNLGSLIYVKRKVKHEIER